MSEPDMADGVVRFVLFDESGVEAPISQQVLCAYKDTGEGTVTVLQL